MITRELTDMIVKSTRGGFINLIYGPRRVGKTVLLQQINECYKNKKVLILNGDTQETRDLLSSTAETQLASVMKDYEVIMIDEAQRITNIGLSLKILIDNFADRIFLVTGSSSLELAKGVQEALTGRTLKYKLYPLSTRELTQGKKQFEKPYLLEEQLIFGGYPYVRQLATFQEKQQYLTSVIDDYLFRDIKLLKEINYPDILQKLATLLAFQIGSEVSLNELANKLGIDVNTVKRYLYLLKQGFVIFELGAWAKNLRKEVAKSKKYYFWDLGVRNALIGQFMSLDLRTDVGQLWENFLVVERLKRHEYSRRLVKYYFWRTYEGAEIDWIEVEDEQIRAFEFKWQESKLRTPKTFKETYKSEVSLVNKTNYLEFVE